MSLIAQGLRSHGAGRLRRAAPLAALVLLTFVASSSSVARAAPPTKEECVETYARAQDQRDRGQMSDARRLFLLCAQQSCPALIQSDCAKFGDDLGRTVPSLSFSARSANGDDIPDAQVFVDDALVAPRTDDGRAHDVDPGRHVVRFVLHGKEVTVSVIVAVGEKNRNVGVVFGEASGGRSGEGASRPDEPRAPRRPLFPLVVAGAGAAALVTGVVLVAAGLARVPDECTTSPRECSAPPGDPVYGDARSAVNLANVGLGVGIAGAAVTALGLVWYFSSAPGERRPASALLVPVVHGREGAGAALRLTF